MNAFLEQVILPLIQINFDVKKNDKAYLSGSIQKKPTRITELATVINSIETLTRFGYMNPANELDFKFARELINAPERMPDPLPDGVLPNNRDSTVTTTTSIQKKETPNPATDYAIEANKSAASKVASTKTIVEAVPATKQKTTKKTK
jgi:hypothetical protein